MMKNTNIQAISFKNTFIFIVYVHMYEHMHAIACILCSEDNTVELILCFHL